MNYILQGDSLETLRKLPAESIDCCVTSPPYYQLRDYGVEGQIGLEATVDEYINRLVDVFHEVHRVLKKDGTLWLNISDSFAGSGKAKGQTTPFAKVQTGNKGILSVQERGAVRPSSIGMKPKDLMGIPWILALALRNDGWYLRQDIIWQKPNPMPESVTDRCTKSHEYIFLLSKSKKYYFDWAAIQEPCVGNNNIAPAGSKGSVRPNTRRRIEPCVVGSKGTIDNRNEAARLGRGNSLMNESGLRRKRSVWTVATRGGNGQHYATYPKKLVEPCILAGSRVGGVVLDPFAGSGTTGIVAAENGRRFVLIELSENYVEICKERLRHGSNQT